MEIFSGTHHKKTCSNQMDVARWTDTEDFFQENRQYLFPTSPLSVHSRFIERRPMRQLNGGWSDFRDRQLCLSFAFQYARNLSSIDMNNFI